MNRQFDKLSFGFSFPFQHWYQKLCYRVKRQLFRVTDGCLVDADFIAVDTFNTVNQHLFLNVRILRKSKALKGLFNELVNYANAAGLWLMVKIRKGTAEF